MKPRPLDLRYDIDADEVTINGQVFSGDYFRMFGLPEGSSRQMLISRDAEGVIVVEPLHDGVAARGVGPLPPSIATAQAPTARRAHVLINKVPLCRHVPYLGYACEHASMEIALAVMQTLHEQHPEPTIEAIAGPCPHVAPPPAPQP